ncbi:MAG: type 4a pilus biogenesis protein PilO [Phycisphaeraceae bacterium]|nr:type 4a pilus biogenesis protein PilO [Phycisphaerales bacterium]MCA9307275.1 type 4a pilus biogenesis protein PilO [Phycisphaerales bacterium]MCB9842153.1 type 4a pilus biogenesis protein PilO [Phycisphaeraceae bacterium]
MKFGIRELLFLAVLIAMPISAYYFVLKPLNRDIEKAKREIAVKERDLEKIEAAQSRTDDLERENEELVVAISTVESRLPSSKEVDVILEQVSELARKSRLELRKVETLKPVQMAGYMEQPLEMTIAGDFDDFYKFLLSVEGLDRITRLPDMEMEKADKQDGAMEATFTLSIYFQNSNGATG